MGMNFPDHPANGDEFLPPSGPLYRFDGSLWQIMASNAASTELPIIPQAFGVVGDGIADDTLAFQTCLNAASVNRYGVYIPSGTYKVSQLVIPANTIVRASQLAVIRSDGTATAVQYVLDIGNNVDFDVLRVTAPGPGAGGNIIRIGDNVRGGLLSAAADVPWTVGGIVSLGNSVVIGCIECDNIDRPLYLGNPTPTTVTATGTHIGFLSCRSYVRALRIDNVSATIGGVRARVKSPNAGDMQPGQNGILFAGAPDVTIGDVWIEDSPEHTIRVGGSPIIGTKTVNLRIGNITAINSAGCVFKLNPTLEVSPGVIETCDNVQVGNILAIDCGHTAGVTGGNREILRISHSRNVSIGNVLSTIRAQVGSGYHGLQINDSRNVQIASLGGTFRNSFVLFDSDSDVTPVTGFGKGDVIGLRIDRLHGTTTGAPSNAISTNNIWPPFNVGDVHIHCDGLSGFSTNLIRWFGNALGGVFRLTGWVGGSVPPGTQDCPVVKDFQIDLTWDNKRAIGRGPDNSFTTLSLAPPAFSSASGPTASFTLNGINAAAGSGLYGGAIEFTRLASSRRGAAIVPRQSTADQKQVGLDFFVGNVTTTANETLALALRLTYAQRLEMYAGLTKYADNAAAIAGGLPVGTLYWTATGEARIVV